MLKTILTITALVLSGPTLAQDRDGNDTPGEWKPTHSAMFGQWDSVCDERQTDTLLESRCYLRYVDVFSPQPSFGALFTFVNATQEGLTLDFGIERGTKFEPNGFRLEKAGEIIWKNTSIACLTFRKCFYDPTEAAPIIELMKQSDRLILKFEDRHGKAQSLLWELSDFMAALEDQEAQVSLRDITE